MIMTETEKQLKDFCNGCKKDLCHGERVILAGNMKFFHFYCYARKNFIFRFFNPIKSFFIWQESFIVLEELTHTLKKCVLGGVDKPKEGIAGEENGGGDTKVEIHELKISKVSDIGKEEMSGEILDISSDDEIPTKSELNEQDLLEIISDVQEMKLQIEEFAAEKENDEKIIKHLERIITKYKRENMELKWENSYLRQERLLTRNSN